MVERNYQNSNDKIINTYRNSLDNGQRETPLDRPDFRYGMIVQTSGCNIKTRDGNRRAVCTVYLPSLIYEDVSSSGAASSLQTRICTLSVPLVRAFSTAAIASSSG